MITTRRGLRVRYKLILNHRGCIFIAIFMHSLIDRLIIIDYGKR